MAKPIPIVIKNYLRILKSEYWNSLTAPQKASISRYEIKFHDTGTLPKREYERLCRIWQGDRNNDPVVVSSLCDELDDLCYGQIDPRRYDGEYGTYPSERGCFYDDEAVEDGYGDESYP